MALFEWRKEFETGIPDVDHEHRELVELLNELHGKLDDRADPETIEAFLGEVFARISAHFALEESVMRKHHYDEYEAHKAEHEELLDEIRDIMDDYAAGRYVNYEERLVSRVHDWFVNHFRTRDARLHKKLGV